MKQDSVITRKDDLFYFLAGDTSYTKENMIKVVPDGVGTNEKCKYAEKDQIIH